MINLRKKFYAVIKVQKFRRAETAEGSEPAEAKGRRRDKKPKRFFRTERIA